mmetsp:Transcript_135343/g.191489  ORF Transcript_135343/g.191489 Transcript_135343/m.191489 type:complete len:216 (+) Transcript_135343:76-723(+)
MLNNLTLLKHINLITFLNSGEFMSNINGRFTLHQLIDIGLYNLLSLRIQSRGSLIHQQHIRLSQHGSSNSDSLLLTTRNLSTLRTNISIEALTLILQLFLFLLLLITSFFLILISILILLLRYNIEIGSLNEFKSVSDSSSLLHLVITSVRLSVFDVFSNGSIKQSGFLRHNSHFRSQMLQIKLLDIDTIDQNLTLFNIVESEQKLHNSGFSATR